MANGYITAADGGYQLAEEESRYVCFDARLPVQPREWTEGGDLERYRITMWGQTTLAASMGSPELKGFHKGWDALYYLENITTAKVAEWIDYDAEGLNPAKPSGEALNSVDFEDINTEPRHAPAYLRYWLGYNSGCTSGEILALHFEFENDEAFVNSDPSSVRDYENIGRNTLTWVPYKKNESVSAWLLQRILAQNLNKILYQTKQVWTVPL